MKNKSLLQEERIYNMKRNSDYDPGTGDGENLTIQAINNKFGTQITERYFTWKNGTTIPGFTFRSWITNPDPNKIWLMVIELLKLRITVSSVIIFIKKLLLKIYGIGIIAPGPGHQRNNLYTRLVLIRI